MLLVSYCFGIRSERRLCQEVRLNLAYRGFCRLDLNDRVPDHSTFSKNRHGRFRESELLRHLFETMAARCIEECLVSGQRLAIDASLIEAGANKQNSTPKDAWIAASIDPADAPRAVREYLDTLDQAAFGAASECSTSALVGENWWFEQRRISGSSELIWSEDETEIRTVESRC